MEIYINGESIDNIKSDIEQGKAILDLINDFLSTPQYRVFNPDSITKMTDSEINLNLNL